MIAWRRLAGFLGAIGVALGAFGAHALRDHIGPDRMDTFRTGVLYHLVHAVLLAALAFGSPTRGRVTRIAMGLFAVGIVVFSGSLYALVLSGQRWWGAITPLGGAAFIAGWVTLFVCAGRGDDARA